MPVKVIIQQGFLSIEMDTLGMGEYADPTHRPAAIQTALGKLKAFLDALELEAAKRPDTEKKSNVIGGVFVLQHAKLWKALFNCPCWP